MNEGLLQFLMEQDKSDNLLDRWTTASLRILINGETVWPVEGEAHIGVEIQIDDLLSHLTEYWKPLVLRQTYPIIVSPARPSSLRAEAEKRWESQVTELVEREDQLVIDFEEAHNLSNCFAGLFDLPPFWILRAGDYMLVEAHTVWSIDFQEARRGLSETGDEIARQLHASGQERWHGLINAWQTRDQGEPADLLAWSASLDREVARSLAGDGTLVAPGSVTEAANDNDELRIAARMASALPAEQIRQIVSLVRGFARQEAPLLSELAAEAQAYIEDRFAKRRPHEQGEAAANFIREKFGLAGSQFVDVFSFVESLGVAVYVETVKPSTLDGIAAWGNRHGPAILLNQGSQRLSGGSDIRGSGPVRITLAHELCHLLLDRAHTLSAIDVLNSRMPRDIEQRAKAFAGEFLLPARVASESWKQAGKPTSISELNRFLDKTGRKYGVSKVVASFKLDHGAYHENLDLSHALDLAVPNRGRQWI